MPEVFVPPGHTIIFEGEKMSEFDPVAVGMNQAHAARHERLQQTAERFNDGSAFAAQESKQSFMLAKMMFGATAQNLLEKEGLADSLLQLKSSGIFPNNLASGGGVVSTP